MPTIGAAYAIFESNKDTSNANLIATHCTYPVTLFIVESLVPMTDGHNGLTRYVNDILLTYEFRYHRVEHWYGDRADFIYSTQQTGVPIYGRYECPKGKYPLVVARTETATEERQTIHCVEPDPTEPCPCDTEGNPIYPSKGVKEETQSDYRAFGPFPLQFVRQFNSRREGWRHNYELKVSDLSQAGTDLGCEDGFGRVTGEAYCYPVVYAGNDTDVLLARGTSRPIAFAQGASTSTNPGVVARLVPRLEVGASSGWWVIDPEKNVFEVYRADGRLTEIHSPSGLRHSLVLSDAATPADVAPAPGLPISIHDTFGRELKLRYDGSGRVVKMLDPADQLYEYEYDGATAVVVTPGPPLSNVTRVTYPDSSRRLYHYNEQVFTDGANMPKLLTGVSDELGVRYATFNYKEDPSGSAPPFAVSTEHAGGVEKFVANPYSLVTNRQTDIVDPLGATRTATYQVLNGVLLETQRTQPAASGSSASTRKRQYYNSGKVKQHDAFNGQRTCYAYGSLLAETTRVEGLTTSASCDAMLSASAVLPGGARKISTQWHPDWRLRTRVAESGHITSSVYNGQPDPFAGGAVASCAPADALLPDGKPIAVLCRQVEQATTDANGSQGFGATPQSGVANREERWTYNRWGQVLTHDGPRTDVNDLTTYAYYSDTSFTGSGAEAAGHTQGDLQSVTNAAGQVTQFTKYNKHGQMLESIGPNGVATTHTYDLRQRLLSTTEAGQTTTYTYDAAGQLTRVTWPDGSHIGYEYDPAHRQTAVFDHLGNRIEYTLDNAGNRIAEQVKDPGGVLSRQLSRSIDALGRVQQTTGRE